MKVAYVGHSYHNKTKSNDFIKDLLEQHALVVDCFYDESWNGGEKVDIEALCRREYDRIVVWQTYDVIEKLVSVLPSEKLIFFPMYDVCHDREIKYWDRLRDIKIISFSSTLYTKLQRFKKNVYFVKYFPSPDKFQQIVHHDSIDVFYWQRREKPSLDGVYRLLPNLDNFHWHRCFDPGFVKKGLSIDKAKKKYENLSVSEWLENPKDIDILLQEKNVYIAPRGFEGIGMSFLEAMSRGQCVIALNNPTMSEYIIDDVDGKLVEDYSTPLNLSVNDIKRLGSAARQTVVNGYRDWVYDYKYRLPAILFESVDVPRARIGFVNAPTSPEVYLRRLPKRPLISIVVVCLNAKEELAKTLDSIIAQDYENYELVVVDGKSNDGTLSVVEKYKHLVSIFVSEPDAGPYDAMNKAAQLATGEWIIYINAGDELYSPASIASLASEVEDDVDFVLGNHLYRNNKLDHFNKVADFESTWSDLINGSLTNDWKRGIPCHQSTLTRRELIAKYRYELDLKIAADHSFLYRMRENGSKFKSINRYISVYQGGGLSAKNFNTCVDEWILIAKKYAPSKAVNEFYLPKKNDLSIITLYMKLKSRLKRLRRIKLKSGLIKLIRFAKRRFIR